MTKCGYCTVISPQYGDGCCPRCGAPFPETSCLSSHQEFGWVRETHEGAFVFGASEFPVRFSSGGGSNDNINYGGGEGGGYVTYK